MSSDLTSFLTDLAQDADLLEQFRRNPAAVLREADLDDTDRRAVMSGDTQVLMAQMGIPAPTNIAVRGPR